MFKQKNGRLFDRMLNAAIGEKSPDNEVVSQAASEGETRLSLAQQAALEHSLRDAAGGKADASAPARFNADVLACLQNTELSQSAGRLVMTRLRWMALPAVVGFVAMSGVSFAWARLLCTPSAPPQYAERDTTAPPLPPLPIIMPGPRSYAGAKAGAKRQDASAATTQTAPSSSAQTPSRADANVKGADHVH